MLWVDREVGLVGGSDDGTAVVGAVVDAVDVGGSVLDAVGSDEPCGMAKAGTIGSVKLSYSMYPHRRCLEHLTS